MPGPGAAESFDWPFESEPLDPPEPDPPEPLDDPLMPGQSPLDPGRRGGSVPLLPPGGALPGAVCVWPGVVCDPPGAVWVCPDEPDPDPEPDPDDPFPPWLAAIAEPPPASTTAAVVNAIACFEMRT